MIECGCGKKAVYFRRNEGRYYCKKCLMDGVEKKFYRTVGRNKLIERGDKIAVGVSGGKDSTVLLYLLKMMQKKKGGFELVAISVDEGIMGYRDKSIKAIGKICKKYGVPHHIYTYKNELGFSLDELMCKKKIKSCTYCGVFRRYILNKKARELGCNKLAVGHNLDDEAQSVLINFVRGDMLRFQRLGAFPKILDDKRFASRIKPLRNIPKREIAAYAIIKRFKIEEGHCPYSFDNMRRDIQTMVNKLEQNYPGTKQQIVNFYDRLHPMISKKSGKVIGTCEKCGEPSSLRVCKYCELLEKIKN
jgi:uncharacterized protein (TIGR00269 family)